MTTKHTCGGPVFGKRTNGCPRCDELSLGAQPVRWHGVRVAAQQAAYAKLPHDCKLSGCNTVCCTYGDW